MSDYFEGSMQEDDPRWMSTYDAVRLRFALTLEDISLNGNYHVWEHLV